MNQSNHLILLNRTQGYEVASVLIDETLSFSEIKRRVSERFGGCHNQEINRILKVGLRNNIFLIPPTRGRKKYTLNEELFSESDLELIQKRAYARSSDDQSHVNVAYQPSMWFHTDLSSVK